ncbi:MAG: septum formation inhibitor Maf [Sandaracinaceae bacterium]
MRTSLPRASLALLLAVACDRPAPTPSVQQPPATAATSNGDGLDLPSPESFGRAHGSFADYWHQGVAELTRYRLRQARYGDVHDGEAVLVFVTEPFLPDLEVKDEDGTEGSIGVLKLNHYRRFFTGIYPYTVLTSTFSPEDGAPALKASGSVSEWCGHAYTQINRRADALEVAAHSYFQHEADQSLLLPAEVRLEDELFNVIRRDPSALPRGETTLVPGLHYLRFTHRDLRGYHAELSADAVDDPRFGGHAQRVTVRYPELERTLRIYYAETFPRPILGFEEDGPEGHTEAVRTNAILTDYWAHHGADDGAYREALGLTE